jgi:hypothetical protein
MWFGQTRRAIQQLLAPAGEPDIQVRLLKLALAARN